MHFRLAPGANRRQRSRRRVAAARTPSRVVGRHEVTLVEDLAEAIIVAHRERLTESLRKGGHVVADRPSRLDIGQDEDSVPRHDGYRDTAFGARSNVCRFSCTARDTSSVERPRDAAIPLTAAPTS